MHGGVHVGSVQFEVTRGSAGDTTSLSPGARGWRPSGAPAAVEGAAGVLENGVGFALARVYPGSIPNMNRSTRQLAVLWILTAAVGCGPARAQNPSITVQGYHISGSRRRRRIFRKWIADMKRWRMEFLKRLGYDDAEYKRPELLWTQSSFMQPQMMVEDRYFYDPVAGRVHGESISGRSGEALRRHRRGAGVARLSEHRHRQPQPVRLLPRYARRHRGHQANGLGFPPARRARSVPDHALGPGNARRRTRPSTRFSPRIWRRSAPTA